MLLLWQSHQSEGSGQEGKPWFILPWVQGMLSGA